MHRQDHTSKSKTKKCTSAEKLAGTACVAAALYLGA